MREKPDYDLFGGSITPLFNAQPPEWFLKAAPEFGPIYAQNTGDDRVIAAREIFGPNMAVRSKVFDGDFLFNETIGPNSSDSDYPMGAKRNFASGLRRKVIRHGLRLRPMFGTSCGKIRSHRLSGGVAHTVTAEVWRGSMLRLLRVNLSWFGF